MTTYYPLPAGPERGWGGGISVLVFFDICTGISLQKIKNSLPTYTAENLTDVYEIEEGDRRTVRFVYPKSETPTLREITYFHVKETPYTDIGDNEGANLEDLDVIVTSRPFTNSHGFQFLDEEPEKTYETKHIVTGEAGDITGEGQLDSGEDLPPVGEDEEYADAMEEVVETETSTEQATDVKKTTTVPPSSITAKNTDIPLLDVTTTSTKSVAKSATTETSITSNTEEPNAVLNSIGPVNEKINARNRLFSQARDKYLLKKQEKPYQKHKREISPDDLPPAPTLPPLDLSILPDDVKMIISSTPTRANTNPKQEEPNVFNEDRLREALHHKIEDTIALLSPNRDEDVNTNDNDTDDGDDANDDDDDDDDDDETDNEDDSDDVVHGEDEDKKVRKPRTYGMNLSNGRGYVWNDLVSDPGMPGMSFDVREPEENSSNNKPDTESLEDKKPEHTDKPTSKTPVDDAHYSTESRPIYISGDNNETDKKEDNPKPSEESPGNTDSKDIEVTTNKLRFLPFENDSSENKEEYDIDDLKLKSNVPSKKESDNKNKHNKGQKKKHEKELKKPENDDFFKELMKNEKFWKWLSDWTATYMELLMKHIKDVVEDEVASQMKTLALKLKKDSEKEASSDKKVEIGNPLNDKKDSSKIMFDGKEIPITHTSNFDPSVEKKSLNNKTKEEHEKVNKENIKAAKHKREKDSRKEHATNVLNKDSNKRAAPTSIRAQSIFGNVVGSDKVTNIFVFYPDNGDSDDNDVMKENAKPLINGADNVFTFDSSDKIDNDQRHPQITGQKDESTMTENKPQGGSIITPDIENSKPTDKPNQDIQERETKNKEEAIHTEPTTTSRSDSDKSETTNDKKELDHILPAKEDETKPDNPNIAQTDTHKDSFESDKETALDNKEKEGKDSSNAEEIKTEDTKDNKDKEATESNKNIAETTITTPASINGEDKNKNLEYNAKGKDSSNAKEIKTDHTKDNKDIEATESNKSIAETTTASSPLSIIGEDKNKILEHNDEKTSVIDDKAKELVKDISKIEVDNNKNKESANDSEKKDDKTKEANDSEKKDDEAKL